MAVGAMKLHQAFHFSVFELSLFALLASAPAAAQLSPGFYSFSCPNAELLVRGAVRSASAMDSTVPAKLLRLLFHDCLVEVLTSCRCMHAINTTATYVTIVASSVGVRWFSVGARERSREQ